MGYVLSNQPFHIPDVNSAIILSTVLQVFVSALIMQTKMSRG